MDTILNYLKDHLIMTIIIGVLLIITVYSVFAVLLNKLNNAKYGKTTSIAWLPIFNVFLLGKLVVHSIVGILLVIALLFGICISFNIPYLESIHSILPKEYVLPYLLIYGGIILLLVVIAKLKLNRTIREGTGYSEMSSFVNKDFNKPEEKPMVDNKKQSIQDNFNYNDALNELSKTSKNNNKNP